MGTCLSKKTSSSPSSSSTTTTSKPAVVAAPPPEPIPKPEPEEQKKVTQVEPAESVKKEIFVIKQRKSHERQRPEERVSNAKAEDSFSADPATTNIASVPLTGSTGVPLRTSSCTKEEVDAILIQCGRLSRSSSSKGGGGGSGKYSGSKRSYDFDQDNDSAAAADKKSSDEDRRHHSRPSHSRNPSREKDVEYKRSSSRDRSPSSREEERRRGRGGSGGSRRTSRSPGRRSETPSAATVSASSAAAADKSKPGKMVSVPASVSSNRDNKIINGGSAAATAAAVVPDSAAVTVVKRVSVKRNSEAAGFRGAASPRSQSPAYSRPNNNSNGENAQHHQQPSLSRNSSRKAEHSPYRRNPMSEIDENCPRCKEQPTLKPQDHIDTTNKVVVAGSNSKMQRRKEGEALPLQNQAAEQQQRVAPSEDRPTEVKGLLPLKTSETALPTSAAENLVPPQPTITRSRSSRRSRDLDVNLGFNPDTLLNPTSYASLLLEDIQNFHQQHNTSTAAAVAAFSLPPCVTKARSILEAVADLNSCTSSYLSSVVFSEERSSEAADWSNNRNTKNAAAAAAASNPNLGKKRLEVNDPFVESEVVVNNDINEPSVHKYVTVRRGMMGGGEVEQQQESSGSNSFVGGQHWAAAASWETNSVESTWTSRSNTNIGEDSMMVAEKESKPIESENQLAVAHDMVEAVVVDARRNSRINGSRSTQLPSMNTSRKRRELQHHQHHATVQQGKVSRAIPVAASASL